MDDDIIRVNKWIDEQQRMFHDHFEEVRKSLVPVGFGSWQEKKEVDLLERMYNMPDEEVEPDDRAIVQIRRYSEPDYLKDYC